MMIETQTAAEVEIHDRQTGHGFAVGPESEVIAKIRIFLENGEEIFPELREQEHLLKLSSKHTVAGLRQGLEGMCAGGIREIVIQPKLAYGEKGVPGVIPEDATLRYEVRLLKVIGH